MSSEILVTAKKYISHLNQKFTDYQLYYHNLKHTTVVYNASLKIAKQANLTHYEKEILLLAALFHDMGCYINYYDHEVHSAELAVSFLRACNYSAKATRQVKQLILATRLSATPSNKLETLMRDADLAGLGSETSLFEERLRMLKKEWQVYLDEASDEKEWIAFNIHFMRKHHYRSKEAQQLFGAQKEKNVKLLQQMLISSTADLPVS